jgi:TM2 domain-containing membrane protein YozV
MNPLHNILLSIQGLSHEEFLYLQHITNGMNEDQLKKFVYVYSGKRKSANDIMLFTLIGFLGIAGIQRFVINQIAMGVIYFLTMGFCFIGTIIDLINHKSLAEEYNQKMAEESMLLVRSTTMYN